MLLLFNQKVRLYITDTTGFDVEIKETNATINLNSWYHICATYNGVGGSNARNGINIYVNGVLQSATGLSFGNYTAMSNTTQPVEIAKSFLGFSESTIDETAIFNTELTSAQVLEIYNNGRPKDLTTFSGTAPISWWRLGENAYFQDTTLVLPNSITGAPNGQASTNNLEMISADAPGTYANGVGTNLAILDRVGDAPLSISNSQSYNMIPSDISPYVPKYVGKQIANNFSMTFDGVNDYINVSTNSSLNFGTGDLTYSIWVKADFSSSNRYFIGTATDPTSNNGGIAIGTHSSQYPSWRVWFSGTMFNTGTAAVADGQWHHLVLTRSSGTVQVYVDGQVDGASTTITTSITNSADIRLGQLTNGLEYWSGEIDEVAIFDKALTADQVKFDLYKLQTCLLR
jgi:hypothetical protein